MRHPSVGGQLGSKPQRREHLVTVVVLDDFSHCLQSQGVGVHLVGVHVMERRGLGWVTWKLNGKQRIFSTTNKLEKQNESVFQVCKKNS